MSCSYCFPIFDTNPNTTLILKELLKLKSVIENDPLNIFSTIDSPTHQALLNKSMSLTQPKNESINGPEDQIMNI
jgi:hypothetical protein